MSRGDQLGTTHHDSSNAEHFLATPYFPAARQSPPLAPPRCPVRPPLAYLPPLVAILSSAFSLASVND